MIELGDQIGRYRVIGITYEVKNCPLGDSNKIKVFYELRDIESIGGIEKWDPMTNGTFVEPIYRDITVTEEQITEMLSLKGE